MKGRKALAGDERGLLGDIKGIITAVTILVVAVLIFVDIAYLAPLVIIVVGALVFLYGGKSKVGAIFGGVIVAAGLIYMAIVTANGGLAMSAISGVP